MKTALAILLLLPMTLAHSAQHVRGYVKKSGAYVVPHYQSNRDTSRMNNWSSKGNVNPYTGEVGKKKVKPHAWQ